MTLVLPTKVCKGKIDLTFFPSQNSLNHYSIKISNPAPQIVCINNIDLYDVMLSLKIDVRKHFEWFMV